MNKLLPCPMCDGEAEFVTADVPQYKHRVACTKCRLMTRGTSFRNDEQNAKDWNRRHAPEEMDGWQTVPVEPTDKMSKEGRLAAMNIQGGYSGPSIWQAMLAAAPTPGGGDER